MTSTREEESRPKGCPQSTDQISTQKFFLVVLPLIIGSLSLFRCTFLAPLNNFPLHYIVPALSRWKCWWIPDCQVSKERVKKNALKKSWKIPPFLCRYRKYFQQISSRSSFGEQSVVNSNRLKSALLPSSFARRRWFILRRNRGCHLPYLDSSW